MYVKEITRDGVYTVYGDGVGLWMESRACGGHEDHTSSSYSAICLQRVYDKSTAGRRNGVRGLEHYRPVGRSATMSSVCRQRQNGLTAGRLRRELPRQTTTQLAAALHLSAVPHHSAPPPAPSSTDSADSPDCSPILLSLYPFFYIFVPLISPI